MSMYRGLLSGKRSMFTKVKNDAAHSIDYLEWVIQESLRLYPPVAKCVYIARQYIAIDLFDMHCVRYIIKTVWTYLKYIQYVLIFCLKYTLCLIACLNDYCYFYFIIIARSIKDLCVNLVFCVKFSILVLYAIVEKLVLLMT